MKFLLSCLWLAVTGLGSCMALLNPEHNPLYHEMMQIVSYNLYVKDNLPKILILNDNKTVESSAFNKSLPTRVIIHGWKISGNSDWCKPIRLAYQYIESSNVICVDWSEKANDILYDKVTAHIDVLGKLIANMLDFLHVVKGLSFQSVTLIGHNLGAHVAGFVGKSIVGGRIAEIIGLDPAGPLFSFERPLKRLKRNDAEFIEVIHTNTDKLGFLKPIGDADFYVNGGGQQPGCEQFHLSDCSSYRAVEYFVEALRYNNFKANRCNNYSQAIQKKCTQRTCVRMGALNNAKNVRGVFFVPVHKQSPYGTGAINLNKPPIFL